MLGRANTPPDHLKLRNRHTVAVQAGLGDVFDRGGWSRPRPLPSRRDASAGSSTPNSPRWRPASPAQLVLAGAVRCPPNTPVMVRTARSTPTRPTMIAPVAAALAQPGVPPWAGSSARAARRRRTAPPRRRTRAPTSPGCARRLRTCPAPAEPSGRARGIHLFAVLGVTDYDAAGPVCRQGDDREGQAGEAEASAYRASARNAGAARVIVVDLGEARPEDRRSRCPPPEDRLARPGSRRR